MLGPEKVGFFVRQHRDELTRIWRMARAEARPEVFPGLLDDVVGSFFETCAALLSRGAAPEEVWAGVAGLVRWQPELAPRELDAEWEVAADVLAAACESVNGERTVSAWLERAASACQAGTAALLEERRQVPAGIVTTFVYSPITPRRGEPGRTDA
jgi:hypothetical protein